MIKGNQLMPEPVVRSTTMGDRVFAATRGVIAVADAATTGYMTQYDNRYLWMLYALRASFLRHERCRSAGSPTPGGAGGGIES